MTTDIALITADQLFYMPQDGCRYELIAGELRMMTPAGWKHGATGSRLDYLLRRHVQDHDLGIVFSGDTGFLLARDPDTVRAPDVAFVGNERIPASEPEEAFWPGAPDLAVEIVSPRDTTGQIDEKVRQWLDAGAAMVWVVNPRWQTVTVYRSATDIRIVTENEDLVGDDVVPGFRCVVRDIFAQR